MKNDMKKEKMNHSGRNFSNDRYEDENRMPHREGHRPEPRPDGSRESARSSYDSGRFMTERSSSEAARTGEPDDAADLKNEAEEGDRLNRKGNLSIGSPSQQGGKNQTQKPSGCC